MARIDAGKKIAGRKRHIGIDTLGLLLAVPVTAANVSDNTGGIRVLSNIAADHPRVTKAWADTGYRTKVIDHGATLGIDVEVTRRDPAHKGFKVIPRRWVVERTFGWLIHHRRLARDYETHPHRSEAMCRCSRKTGSGSLLVLGPRSVTEAEIMNGRG